jgi:hypothetical protein
MEQNMAYDHAPSSNKAQKDRALAYHEIIEAAIVGTSGMAYTDGFTNDAWDSDPTKDGIRKRLATLVLSNVKVLIETANTPEALLEQMTRLHELKTTLNPPELSEAERKHDAKQLLDAQKEIAMLYCQAVAGAILNDVKGWHPTADIAEVNQELKMLVFQDFEQIIGRAETSEELLQEMTTLKAYQEETKPKLATQAFKQEISALKPSSKAPIESAEQNISDGVTHKKSS